MFFAPCKSIVLPVVRYNSGTFWDTERSIDDIFSGPVSKASDTDRPPAECFEIERSNLWTEWTQHRRFIYSIPTRVSRSMSPKEGTINGCQWLEALNNCEVYKLRSYPTTESSWSCTWRWASGKRAAAIKTVLIAAAVCSNYGYIEPVTKNYRYIPYQIQRQTSIQPSKQVHYHLIQVLFVFQ